MLDTQIYKVSKRDKQKREVSLPECSAKNDCDSHKPSYRGQWHCNMGKNFSRHHVQPFCRKNTTFFWESACFQILLTTWQWKIIYDRETQYLIQISPGQRSLNWWTGLTCFACLWNHCCGILSIICRCFFLTTDIFSESLFLVFIVSTTFLLCKGSFPKPSGLRIAVGEYR